MSSGRPARWLWGRAHAAGAGGLAPYDGAAWESYMPPVLEGHTVNVIASITTEDLWLGTTNGLVHFRPGAE